MSNGHAIICALFLSGCSSPKEPAKVTPSSAEEQAFLDASMRLLAMTSPPGWVVSRHDDDTLEHTGDSLLWTGMAMGVLGCDRGAAPETAILDMLTSGKVYRHPAETKPVSLDGQIGMLWGIAKRVEHCPDATSTWAIALAAYQPVNMPAPFDQLASVVKQSVGIDAPQYSSGQIADAVNGWALAVMATKAAAYRIHLGLLSYQILEATGVDLPKEAREKFCLVTKGADMPTLDHFCGRGDLKGWADSFVYDAYEYRHQRAKWEEADGRPGLRTPGLDLIVALRTLFEPLP